jgi:2-polyprenyl-3-methyl-5-hydroxy-6-metoxy-1,4-benzoquinol methylase
MSHRYFANRNICPGCHSVQHRTLYAGDYLAPPIKSYLEAFYAPQGGIEFEYLSEARYILEECLECGLIYQAEIPNDFLMTKLYDQWIEPSKVFGDDDDLGSYAEYAQEVMMLVAWLRRTPGSPTFLDFGMGWGRWLRMARAFGGDVYGTELSASRITYAQSEGIKVIAWDEIPEHRFDFINTEQVCEHLPQPLETLRYLAASLRPNGLIKISVPNGSDFKRRLKAADWAAPKFSKNSLNAAAPLEHINCFNYQSLLRMADLAGLKPTALPWSIQLKYRLSSEVAKEALKIVLRKYFRGRYLKRLYFFFRPT